MSKIENATRFKKTDSFVESIVDEEVVLMDIDNGSFFTLTGTGKSIWLGLDDASNFGALVQDMMAQYNVSEDICLPETQELLEDLLNRKLIEISA